MQPFHKARAFDDRLAVLARVSNADKHRKTHLARIALEAPAYVAWYTGTDEAFELQLKYNLTSPVQPNCEALIGMTRGAGLDGGGVAMSPRNPAGDHAGLTVMFGSEPAFYDVPRLKEAIRYAGAVVEWFEPGVRVGVTARRSTTYRRLLAFRTDDV